MQLVCLSCAMFPGRSRVNRLRKVLWNLGRIASYMRWGTYLQAAFRLVLRACQRINDGSPRLLKYTRSGLISLRERR